MRTLAPGCATWPLRFSLEDRTLSHESGRVLTRGSTANMLNHLARDGG